jgi:hypothetical protein
MAGGQSGGVESYLPIAAALAATIATDGAASPWLVEAMGSEAAAGAVMGAGAGALGGGITAAVTGQDVGRNALMGGIGGATLGYGMAPGTTEAVTGATSTAPTIANAPVSGSLATPSLDAEAQIGGFYGGSTPVNPYADTSMLNAGDAEAQVGGFYGGSTPANPYANMSNSQIQSAMTQNAPVTPGNVNAASTAGNWLSNNKGIAALGGTALLGALIQNDNKRFGTPANQPYSGPLSKFKYDPNQYKATIAAQPNPAYQPVYPNYAANPYMAAEGGVIKMADGGLADANPMENPSIGPVEQMSRDNAVGQNQMFPQAGINSPAFSSATNTPMGTNMIAPAGDINVDPYSGAERFAAGGGIASGHLGSYAAGGNPHLLKGPGDGMSDNIPATIGGKQPARLADGEFVVPADVVSHLGNGSTDAGAKHLYDMMDKVRKARTGTKKQGKQIKAAKYLKA